MILYFNYFLLRLDLLYISIYLSINQSSLVLVTQTSSKSSVFGHPITDQTYWAGRQSQKPVQKKRQVFQEDSDDIVVEEAMFPCICSNTFITC